ncbi:HTH-type transcriptional regulatory protein gabR [Serratia entomophila]|uniref:MocR-like pyridoxine biosynthesis transcription factor PdxR n=1 Tax=Serratia entomophila TaxID=42906 RepID=UPI002178246F|nr:PLP-dependent aminotransferase family protein [Serratia entomophila]CAI0702137.1 HTH-type transcriptional regulatory protein gabR [Serratia entomophila]CAI1693200.1 HTH-type transcriptional regulatory protein gabR [Serratia entomophila]CAI1708170.1 HTH-type transcriptional regulatory protein gabR [Serratia entomophila]CAI1809358.1 HTH-type transcriptional regulatory protein gabR [Serratia entomophila]
MSHALIALFQQPERSGGTLRDRLCGALRQAIHRGALSCGQRLPSSRILASDLGVSRVTAEAAYAQLEAEGYLQRRVGQGTFVAVNLAKPTAPAKGSLLPRLSLRGQQIVQTGGCQDPQRPLPFAAGSPDLRAFPLKLWKQLTAQRLQQQGESLLRYGDPQGYPPLREAIAAHVSQTRGVRCDAQQVIVLTSSQQALQLVATLLLDNGDRVWMEEPGYGGARNAFVSAGAELVAVNVDEAGMRPDACLPDPRLIYLTPSHQYPTGSALGLERRLELLAIAERRQAWIIEDDYDSEFHYDGLPMPALQGLDPRGKVLYIGTFSKALFPSLRLAYAVVPPALVAPFVTARTLYDGHSAQLMQAVTAEFILQGHFAAHIRYMRQLYRSRRDVLLAEVRDKLGHFATPQQASGGLQLSVWLPPGQEAALSGQAQRLGVVTPGLAAQYQTAQARRDGWLLGFSALTPGEIRAAVAQLARIVMV